MLLLSQDVGCALSPQCNLLGIESCFVEEYARLWLLVQVLVYRALLNLGLLCLSFLYFMTRIGPGEIA